MLKLILFLCSFLAFTQAQADSKMSEVTKEIERINSVRESLVGGVQGHVDAQTFQAVCKPVGKELKKLGKELNVKIKQTSLKYRNSNHSPNKIEKKILDKMNKDKSLLSLWRTSKAGLHYYRRINVQKACLNCHGSKASRPDFIKKKYPFDKAFGFKEGDLRGMYSVFIKTAL